MNRNVLATGLGMALLFIGGSSEVTAAPGFGGELGVGWGEPSASSSLGAIDLESMDPWGTEFEADSTLAALPLPPAGTPGFPGVLDPFQGAIDFSIPLPWRCLGDGLRGEAPIESLGASMQVPVSPDVSRDFPARETETRGAAAAVGASLRGGVFGAGEVLPLGDGS